MLVLQLLVGSLPQTSTGVLWDPDAAIIIHPSHKIGTKVYKLVTICMRVNDCTVTRPGSHPALCLNIQVKLHPRFLGPQIWCPLFWRLPHPAPPP